MGIKRQAMGCKTTDKEVEKIGKRGCKKTGKGFQKRQGWVRAKKDMQVGPRSTARETHARFRRKYRQGDIKDSKEIVVVIGDGKTW
jgi:hypothetical protein